MKQADPFNFDNPMEQRGACSAKWDKYRGRDIIPLWLADMDFRSPPAVIAALHERVEHGVFGLLFNKSTNNSTIVSQSSPQVYNNRIISN